jgi:thymidylate synthase
MVQQYLDHCRQIFINEDSGFKDGSKGSGLISLFGYQSKYGFEEGFPLLTTKKMATKSMFHETIWFLRGDTNIEYLEKNKVKVWRGNAFDKNLPEMVKAGIFPDNIVKYSPDWDKAMLDYAQMIRENHDFAMQWGDAGPIYGKQWRGWEYFDADKKEIIKIDQLGDVIEKLKKKPMGKKHIVTAWNPGDVPKMSLEPCHVMFQMTSTEDGRFFLQMYQRSSDQFLGVPFNTASYWAITKLIAQEVGLTPQRFIHTFGDTHFYMGLEKRTKWYKENFKELQSKVKNVKDRKDYLEILNWVNEKAPKDPNEEKYDHITAILEQLSREPRKLPQLNIAKKPFDKLNIEDFVVSDYDPHPEIKREMLV